MGGQNALLTVDNRVYRYQVAGLCLHFRPTMVQEKSQ